MASGSISTPLTRIRGQSCSLLAISNGSASAPGAAGAGSNSTTALAAACGNSWASSVSSNGLASGLSPPQPPEPPLVPPHPHAMTTSNSLYFQVPKDLIPGLAIQRSSPGGLALLQHDLVAPAQVPHRSTDDVHQAGEGEQQE